MLPQIIKQSEAKFVSFEVCPNRNLDIELITKLKPKFCSVPWLSDYHFKETISEIPPIALAHQLKSRGHEVLLHIAGNKITKAHAFEILDTLKSIGIKNILAVQGDPSFHLGDNASLKDSFKYASELVAFINQNFENDFSVGVAGYPERHPECKSLEDDLSRLKEKIDYGGHFIITQACFDYENLRQFHKNCKNFGINIPIIPGIFLINSYESAKMMSKIKIPVPEDIINTLCEKKQDVEWIKNFGIKKAKHLIHQIFEDNLFPGVHVFTLNDLPIVEKLCNEINTST